MTVLAAEINELRPLLLRMLRDADGFAFSQEEGGSVTQTDVIRAYDTNLPKPGGMWFKRGGRRAVRWCRSLFQAAWAVESFTALRFTRLTRERIVRMTNDIGIGSTTGLRTEKTRERRPSYPSILTQMAFQSRLITNSISLDLSFG